MNKANHNFNKMSKVNTNKLKFNNKKQIYGTRKVSINKSEKQSE